MSAKNAPPKPKPASLPPKPTKLRFARAQFAYDSQDPDVLSFKAGDLLYILDDTLDADWWRVRCHGKTGLVPVNYLSAKSSSSGPGAGGDELLLHDACRRGNLDLLEELLLNRVPVNALDRAGNTPLHWACHAGQTDCARRLLAVPQVNVGVANRLGDTPLHQAAYKGRLECVRALRELAGDAVNLDAENGEARRPRDVCEDADTRAELDRWLRQKKGGDNSAQHREYGMSDDEDEDNENE